LGIVSPFFAPLNLVSLALTLRYGGSGIDGCPLRVRLSYSIVFPRGSSSHRTLNFARGLFLED